MLRSHTPHTLPVHNQTNYHSNPTTIRHRLRSLQKIKLCHKGLPNDFFQPQNSYQIPQKFQKHKRTKTLPDDLEEIRVTPKFIYSNTGHLSQRRQSRSQERIGNNTKRAQPVSSPFLPVDNQITFTSNFFTNEIKRPKTITIQRKNEDKKVQEKPKEIVALSQNIQKNQLALIMKRRQLEGDKKKLLLYPRTQPKHKKMLPLLKSKYPSAFGV